MIERQRELVHQRQSITVAIDESSGKDVFLIEASGQNRGWA
jgi:hypothetical protein